MPKTVGYDTQTLLKILMDLDIDLMDVDSDEGMLDALKEGAAKLQVGGNTTDERYNILVRAIKHLRDKRKKVLSELQNSELEKRGDNTIIT